MPNAPVHDANGAEQRLDVVLGGRLAVLTGADPSPRLVDVCRKDGLLLVCVHADGTALNSPTAERVDVVVRSGQTPLEPFLRRSRLAVVVRPDAVVAAVSRCEPPTVPSILPRVTTTVTPTMAVAR